MTIKTISGMRVYFLFILLFLGVGVRAQLILSDNFSDYPAGNLNGQGSPAWLPFLNSGGAPDIQVMSTAPLNYPGYESGGSYVNVAGRASGIGRSSFRGFTKNVVVNNTVGAPTQTIYYSFLVRIADASTTISNGNYTVSLRRATGTSENESVGRFSVNKEAVTGNWIFGVAAGNGFTSYNTGSNSTSRVFLLLMRFDVIPGSNNDMAYMWVDPSLAAEPTLSSANAVSGGNNLDFGTQLDALMIFQRDVPERPSAQLDAFKVSLGITSAEAFSGLASDTTQPVSQVRENFTGYTNGNLSPQGNWISFSNGSAPRIQVQNISPLIFPYYPAGPEYITVANRAAGTGISDYKFFNYPVYNHDIPSGSTQTIYYTFLVRVSEAFTTQDNGNYSVSLRRGAGQTENESVARFSINKDVVSGNWQFRVAAGTAQSAPFTTASSSTSEVFFITVRYDIIPNAADAAWLWVNPAVGIEPSIATAQAISLTGSNNYGDRLDALMVFQRDVTGRPAAQFDGFRTASGNSSAEAYARLQLSPLVVLPVTFTDVNITKTGKDNLIQWETGVQDNVANFELQKSVDGVRFITLASLPATATRYYNYLDMEVAPGRSYYRIRANDQDGRFTYSNTVQAERSPGLALSIYPNPAQTTVELKFPPCGPDALLKVINQEGQLLLSRSLTPGQVSSVISVSGWTPGTYFINFTNGGITNSAKLIKQ